MLSVIHILLNVWAPIPDPHAHLYYESLHTTVNTHTHTLTPIYLIPYRAGLIKLSAILCRGPEQAGGGHGQCLGEGAWYPLV
jgi:hypothetical protein